jgi:hypothetical protein
VQKWERLLDNPIPDGRWRYITVTSKVDHVFLALSEESGQQENFGPTRDFVPWLDNFFIGYQLIQIGITEIPLLQDIAVDDVNSALGPTSTAFNIVGNVKARCSATC